ncbi:MAG: metallophosphoesterase [Planctomycetes bacterium]|nr:metallophosphoesterase [Planctomycetota bacterium]
MTVRRLLLACGLVCFSSFAPSVHAEITRLWLSHQTNDPSRLVINWESAAPGDSVVRYSVDDGPEQTVRQAESTTLHHVEIPFGAAGAKYRYQVQTGKERSATASFHGYAADELRVAVVADWQGKPKLDALLADRIDLLLTAGDNIGSLHGRCGVGVKDCTTPYGELIDAYPELFRSTPFLPALGNHDREIRPRGNQPPAEPVYDVEATAFRQFFALPDAEWRWRFDVPTVGARFLALDLNHISDQGTTYQTCHPLDPASEQFRWYQEQFEGARPRFVVTLQNERNATMRAQHGATWHRLFRQGSLVISGFGYFAERAEVDGLSYYNTALGVGAKYPDPQSKFFASVASYVLLSIKPDAMRVELKSLAGDVLDARTFVPLTERTPRPNE